MRRDNRRKKDESDKKNSNSQLEKVARKNVQKANSLIFLVDYVWFFLERLFMNELEILAWVWDWISDNLHGDRTVVVVVILFFYLYIYLFLIPLIIIIITNVCVCVRVVAFSALIRFAYNSCAGSITQERLNDCYALC